MSIADELGPPLDDAGPWTRAQRNLIQQPVEEFGGQITQSEDDDQEPEASPDAEAVAPAEESAEDGRLQKLRAENFSLRHRLRRAEWRLEYGDLVDLVPEELSLKEQAEMLEKVRAFEEKKRAEGGERT